MIVGCNNENVCVKITNKFGFYQNNLRMIKKPLIYQT